MYRTLAILGLLALPVAVQPVAAQPAPTPKPSSAPAAGDAKSTVAHGDSGRFTMTPSGEGFLRLDTRSGAVSFCTVKDGAAQCRAGADERNALEGEIGRLTGENAKLKTGALTGAPAAATGSAAAPPQSFASSLPSEAEVDRAMSLLDKIVRGTIHIMKEVDQATGD